MAEETCAREEEAHERESKEPRNSEVELKRIENDRVVSERLRQPQRLLCGTCISNERLNDAWFPHIHLELVPVPASIIHSVEQHIRSTLTAYKHVVRRPRCVPFQCSSLPSRLTCRSEHATILPLLSRALGQIRSTPPRVIASPATRASFSYDNQSYPDRPQSHDELRSRLSSVSRPRHPSLSPPPPVRLRKIQD